MKYNSHDIYDFVVHRIDISFIRLKRRALLYNVMLDHEIRKLKSKIEIMYCYLDAYFMEEKKKEII